jgi:hypothetical protein
MSCYRNYEDEARKEAYEKQRYSEEVEEMRKKIEGGKLAEVLASLSLYKQGKY